jgi:hypothetical protein
LLKINCLSTYLDLFLGERDKHSTLLFSRGDFRAYPEIAIMQDQTFTESQQSAILGGSDHGKKLCLLSLDGGGVKGMSSLIILKKLMKEIGPDSRNPPKPCEYFDMIGGTSTGGYMFPAPGII